MAHALATGSRAAALRTVRSYRGVFLKQANARVEIYTGTHPQTQAKVYLIVQKTGLDTYKVLESTTCAC